MNSESLFTGERMKKFTNFLGASVILLLTAWLIYYFYQRHIYIITDNAFQMADIVEVSTQDVSGKITNLFKKEFEPVKKGEILFQVDDSIYRKELQEVENEVSSLKARRDELLKRLSQLKKQLPAAYLADVENLNSLKSKLKELEREEIIARVNWKTSVEKAKTQVKAARKELESASFSYEHWRKQLKRYRNLYERRVISKEQLEEVELSFKESLSRLEHARANLKVSEENLKSASSLNERVKMIIEQQKSLMHKIKAFKEKVKVSKANLIQIDRIKDLIKEADSNIESAERRLERVKILLSRATVKSPISGFVAKRWREKGDFVSPGLPVYSVYNPETFYVLAWIDEDKLKYVKVGNKVRAELESCGKTFFGSVSSVGTSAGSTFALIPRDTSQGDYTKVTQRVPVRIELREVPLECVKPGTNVTVFVEKR